MNITDKLYYKDSHLYNFESEITEIIPGEKYSSVVLSATAFFPEGGGQKADTGYIDNIRIFDTVEENGIIYHKTKDTVTFEKGDKVTCKIDSEQRFLRMQSHSGEHIVSGIAHKLFGADNVGFHMDENNLMTVDFNVVLDKDQINEIEYRANECVYRNIPVTTRTVSSSEAEGLSFRSKKEFTGDIRIVDIGDADSCACCAPHVSFTGEIGLIKILSCISHRGGVRITLICGRTAYEDYRDKYRQTLNISALLCAKHNETDIAAERVAEQVSSLKYEISELKKNFNKKLAAGVPASDILCCYFSETSMSDLLQILNYLKGKYSTCAFVYSGDEDKGYTFCFYSDILNMKKISEAVKKELNGRGGGRDGLIQGSLKCRKEDISKFLSPEEIKKYEDA